MRSRERGPWVCGVTGSGQLFAVAVGLLLAACSSGKSTAKDAGDGSVVKDAGDGSVVADPVDAFASAVRNALCERSVACLQYPDVATCIATQQIGYGFGVEAWVSSVKRGHARFDSAAAASCLDGIPRDCLVVDPEMEFVRWLGQYLSTPPCLAAFVGSAQPGDVCESTVECANKHCGGGSTCPGAGIFGACRPGADFQAPGAPCDNLDSLCEFDATCGPNGTCLGQLPVGASCGDTTPPCGRATTCTSANGATPQTCVSLPATGQACDPSTPMPCARIDDYCDATTNLCARRRKPGESCVQYDCVVYASCDNFVCKTMPNVGESCSNPLNPCIPDIPCVDGVCTPATLASCP